jgi:hypothetical protein
MTTPADLTHALVEEIVRTGLMMTGLLEDLLESLPEDAFPGESHADVLLEMLAGSTRPAVTAAGHETVRELMSLLGAVRDRTLSDLRAAAAAAPRT